jgi:hypothetical protein
VYSRAVSRQVLRARLTYPIVFTCVALGVAAAAWFLPSREDIIIRGGRLKSILPLVPIVVGLLFGAWACTRPRVIVDDDGVRMRRLLRWVPIRWDEIDRYAYVAGTPANVKKGGAISAIARARAARNPHRYLENGLLRLWARDGRTLRFGPGLFFENTRVAEVFDRVLAAIHPRLRSRSDLAFTPVRIHDGQLEHPAMPAPLAFDRIERVVIADSLDGFQVRHVDGKSWLAVKLIEIPNLWLLVETLRARGVQVDIAPGVFVPRDISPT